MTSPMSGWSLLISINSLFRLSSSSVELPLASPNTRRRRYNVVLDIPSGEDISVHENDIDIWFDHKKLQMMAFPDLNCVLLGYNKRMTLSLSLTHCLDSSLRQSINSTTSSLYIKTISLCSGVWCSVSAVKSSIWSSREEQLLTHSRSLSTTYSAYCSKQLLKFHSQSLMTCPIRWKNPTAHLLSLIRFDQPWPVSEELLRRLKLPVQTP